MVSETRSPGLRGISVYVMPRRPLRTIPHLPALKALVNTILLALPHLGQVYAVVGFLCARRVQHVTTSMVWRRGRRRAHGRAVVRMLIKLR